MQLMAYLYNMMGATKNDSTANNGREQLNVVKLANLQVRDETGQYKTGIARYLC